MKKFVNLLLILALITVSYHKLEAKESQEAVFAMCRPTISQIKNIEWLYEKDLINLRRIKLLCVYHEDEVTDYEPAFVYITRNKLNWVEFIPIKGMEKMENLFKKNRWTQDFLKIFKASSGIIFTGGMDIPPAIYQAKTSLLTEPTTPVRSLYEVSFLFHLIGGSQNPRWIPFLEKNKNYCIMAICLGAQTMNVAAGGDLYQDIPSEVYQKMTAEDVQSMPVEKIHSSRYKYYVNPLLRGAPPVLHSLKLMKLNFW
jgi:putative glutamine amidotransferase